MTLTAAASVLLLQLSCCHSCWLQFAGNCCLQFAAPAAAAGATMSLNKATVLLTADGDVAGAEDVGVVGLEAGLSAQMQGAIRSSQQFGHACCASCCSGWQLV